ncbi:hypothetical protein K239x_29210 [Planctomycetes bacterium K23_9]|uniref:Uncharacterized protein n=1 Tax=Stieleria marina TaxID=1930275 RepID=A0A517NUX1_9BACT|nr:hypothetical protein K239x_29210 [Planctomycetes bacterium K23_9]
MHANISEKKLYSVLNTALRHFQYRGIVTWERLPACHHAGTRRTEDESGTVGDGEQHTEFCERIHVRSFCRVLRRQIHRPINQVIHCDKQHIGTLGFSVRNGVLFVDFDSIGPAASGVGSLDGALTSWRLSFKQLVDDAGCVAEGMGVDAAST